MLKNILILPDGTELSSGVNAAAIRSLTLTEWVNSENELTLGSACSNMLEATLFDIGGKLELSAGSEVGLFQEDGNVRVNKGVFILEKPTRPSSNLVKITGYDRMVKLDKDLSSWLKELTGWPYPLKTFASMVCTACGLTFVAEENLLNGDFPVPQFSGTDITGRQIMQWLGEICCKFCRVNADGNVEFSWYEPTDILVKPTGDRYFFQNGLSFEAYEIAPIEAVQIRLADGENGLLLPAVSDDANRYVISGNAIVLAAVQETILPYLQNMQQELAKVSYTPCAISLPASLDIHAGSIIRIEDRNGKIVTCYVMKRKNSGQKDTLECTGSYRRDSASEHNYKNDAFAKEYAAAAAQNVINGQSQTDVFNKLTDNGKAKGLYMIDGELYVNASYLSTGVLASKDGDTFYLDLDNGTLKGKFSELSIASKTVDEIAQEKANSAESNAISAAATDATNKANSAQENAISAAATDATNKANAAENSAKAYADGAAAGAVSAQTQTDIFNKLTNNGEMPGLFMQNGQLYINSSYLATGVISSADGSIQIDLNSGGLGPVFNRGVSVGSVTVRSDILGDDSVFHAGTLQGSDGGRSYLTPWMILDKPDRTKAFEVRSYFNAETNSYYGCVTMDSVNPGKKQLFYGFVAQGETCTVPNTALYDLFSVQLGDEYETSETVALCYKVGSKIRGVGGWCGTAELSKELYFFSATFSGDTWTIEDCGRHDVYSGGYISEGTRLKLKKVIGII